MPPAGARVPAPEAPPPAEIPADLLDPGGKLTLTRLIDLALRTNPATRESWAAARSAEAGLGGERGAYYPTVDLQATVTRAEGSAAGGKIAYEQTSYGPALVVEYLLLDLGGRRASVDEARLALIGANWRHNAAVQDVALGVVEAYIRYLSIEALLGARRDALGEARTAFDAATARHDAGVATIADVLQTKTALAQAQLGADEAEGEILVTRGALATAVGLPANAPLDVETPVNDLDIEPLAQEVDRLIEEALEASPELAGTRAAAAQAWSHVAKVESDGRPSLVFSGEAGRIWYGGGDPFQNAYSAGLLLRVPLFRGFSQRYGEARARADAQAADARVESLRQQVVYRVWAGYYDARTAAQKVRTVGTLVESAAQSNEVALGRYRAGVGSLVDLLVAQAALSSARAEQVAARAEWFLSLARLARDTGTLWPRSAAPRPAASPTDGTTRGAP